MLVHKEGKRLWVAAASEAGRTRMAESVLPNFI
jgi:hypothetical protein